MCSFEIRTSIIPTEDRLVIVPGFFMGGKREPVRKQNSEGRLVLLSKCPTLAACLKKRTAAKKGVSEHCPHMITSWQLHSPLHARSCWKHAFLPRLLALPLVDPEE